MDLVWTFSSLFDNLNQVLWVVSVITTIGNIFDNKIEKKDVCRLNWSNALPGSVLHLPIYVIVISNSLWKVLQDHGVLFPILRLFNSALEFNVFNEGEKKKERKRCERVGKESLTDWWKAFQQLYFSIMEHKRCL